MTGRYDVHCHGQPALRRLWSPPPTSHCFSSWLVQPAIGPLTPIMSRARRSNSCGLFLQPVWPLISPPPQLRVEPAGQPLHPLLPAAWPQSAPIGQDGRTQPLQKFINLESGVYKITINITDQEHPTMLYQNLEIGLSSPFVFLFSFPSGQEMYDSFPTHL